MHTQPSSRWYLLVRCDSFGNRAFLFCLRPTQRLRAGLDWKGELGVPSLCPWVRQGPCIWIVWKHLSRTRLSLGSWLESQRQSPPLSFPLYLWKESRFLPSGAPSFQPLQPSQKREPVHPPGRTPVPQGGVGAEVGPESPEQVPTSSCHMSRLFQGRIRPSASFQSVIVLASRRLRRPGAVAGPTTEPFSWEVFGNPTVGTEGQVATEELFHSTFSPLV